MILIPRTKQTRRGNNEGSISRRPNGKIMAQMVTGIKDDGRLARITKYFDGPLEAREWLDDQRALLRRGVELHPKNCTFGELARTWLETQKATVAVNTYEKYTFNFRHLATFEKKHPRAVREELQAHLNNLGQQLSPSTLRGVYYIARAVLELALENDLILRLPKIKLPKLMERVPRTLNTEQISYLLDAAKTSKYSYGLWLELGTGLRRGMLLALDWDDFNFDDNTVTASKRMIRHGSVWEIKSGAKTKAGARVYDVPPTIMSYLKTLAKPGQPMFQTDTSTRLSLWNWSRLFYSWRKHADQSIEKVNTKREKNKQPLIPKLGDTRFHDLRHQFASFLQGLGVHVFTIQDMGGWSDLDMARRYSHTSREQTRAASNALDAVIKPLLQ